MVAVIFYVLFCGISGRISIFTWLAIGIVILEGIVLLLFNMSCPLTVFARRYSNSKNDNFDIYLPVWLARYNKLIFTSIFIIGLLSLMCNLIK